MGLWRRGGWSTPLVLFHLRSWSRHTSRDMGNVSVSVAALAPCVAPGWSPADRCLGDMIILRSQNQQFSVKRQYR
jgi:hypothetical protein